MAELRIQITSFADNHNPGWVKCCFSDIHGDTHYFEEKVPVVTADFLNANSLYPQAGSVGCQILDKSGNRITIDISQPLGIQTETGKIIFEVSEDQIISY